MEKDISNKELLESINRAFTSMEEKMFTKEDSKAFATKTDLLETASRLQTQINGISADMKSFKEEVRHELLLNK